MIVNVARTQAISNLGWVDGGALWLYSLHSKTIRRLTLSTANYLSVFQGTNDFFAVVHHWAGERLEISAHHHSDPNKVIGRASLEQRLPVSKSQLKITFSGEPSVWAELRGAYVAYAFGDYRLIRPLAEEDEDVQEFSWYDTSYDKGYQGVIGAIEIPGGKNVIISIQRDSCPVVYDPETRQVIRKLALANRGGNPEFIRRETASEFWASDYDSVVKLSSATLEVKQTHHVQGSAPGTQAFIGEFCFDAEEKTCAIARPFSRDVIMLDADSMRPIGSTNLGGQPLAIGLLVDGILIARDWKTGDLLSAESNLS
jgi:hypothetical protein